MDIPTWKKIVNERLQNSIERRVAEKFIINNPKASIRDVYDDNPYKI